MSRRSKREAAARLAGRLPQERFRLVYDEDGVHLDDYAAELFVTCNRCGDRIAHLRAGIQGAARHPVLDPPASSFGDLEKQRAIFRQMLDPKIELGEVLSLACPGPTCRRAGVQLSTDRLLEALFDAWRDSQMGDRRPRRVSFRA